MGLRDQIKQGYQLGRGGQLDASDGERPPARKVRDLVRQLYELNLELTESKEVIAALLAEVEVNRAQSTAQHDMEEIFRDPRVKTALVKAFHPDTQHGASETERREREAMFKTLMAAFERVGDG